MTVSSFEGKTPVIGEGAWVHPKAEVIGDVTSAPAAGSGRAPAYVATTAPS